MTQAGMSERRLGSVSEMTSERLAELRRIAEAATPGPWELDIRKYGFCIRMGSAVPYKPQHLIGWDPGVCYASGYPETDAENRQYLEAKANARHISAFDPPTVLTLLDEIERLRRVVEDAQSATQRAQEWMRANGVQVADPSDPMQRAVFEVYNLLVELAQQAESALLDGERGGDRR